MALTKYVTIPAIYSDPIDINPEWEGTTDGVNQSLL